MNILSNFKPLLFTLSFLCLISCDKDFNEIGANLIGDSNFVLQEKTFDVIAYNQKIDALESNNLPINPFGIFQNNAFDKTTANFATQLSLVTTNVKFDKSAVIESVYLEIPYFFTNQKVDSNGGFIYELESIYGNPNIPMKLSVYESGVYMDNRSGKIQPFYTDQNPYFEKEKGTLLNDDLNDKSQNESFTFKPTQYTIITLDADKKEVKTYLSPRMRLKLNNDFFKNKIINSPSVNLSNQDLFDNYFKGLYFKIEETGNGAGALAMLNFAAGTIKIKYTEDSSTTPTTKLDRTFEMKLTGNTASLLESSNKNAIFESTIKSPNKTDGDDRLFLKGGQGSMAIIKLFTPNQLNKIKSEGWLINNASLEFFIDKEDTNFKNSAEPERLYLYNYNDGNDILDYTFDSPNQNKNLSKLFYGGRIVKKEIQIDDKPVNRGYSYKFNITSHIRNLVKNKEDDNDQLGLAVTEDINNSSFGVFKNDVNSKAPKATVMNPLGTILHGSTSSVSSDKKIKFKIYYSKPK